MSDNPEPLDFVDTKRKDFEIEFTENERKNNINQCVSPVDTHKYLSFTPEQLNKLSAQECSVAKYMINQHALAIQRSLNKSVAVKNWASRNFDIVISKEIEYTGVFFRHEVVADKICIKNSYAKKLRDIIIAEQCKIDSLSYVIKTMQEMGNSLSSLAYSKKEEYVPNNKTES